MESATTPPPVSKLYGPLEAIVITIGVYFGAQLLSGILLSLIPSLFGWSIERTTNWLSTSASAQFLFFVLAESVTLFVLYKVLKRHKANFSDVGLNKPRVWYIFQALAGFVVYFVAYIVVLTIATRILPGLNVDQKQELGFSTGAHGKDLWLIFASLVILAPITEEIVVRGFLYGSLKTKLSPLLSAVIASALFAAAHLGEGGKGGLLWVAAVDTFILSIVLCYIRDRSNSLWPCIGIHMIKNGVAFALLFDLVKYAK